MKKRRKQRRGEKKREIGTKLYPSQLAYIDAIAYQKSMTRYQVIYAALQYVFGFPD